MRPVPETPKKYFTPEFFVVTGFVLFFSILILIAGLWSGGVSLGDEVHHFRYAKNSFLQGQRATFDLVYGSGEVPGFYYATDILWPLGLALLWKVLGGISFGIAQLYQTFFYALLLVSTYGVARKIYGEIEARCSVFLAATLPMLVSFGTLFYVDVPATAFAMLGLWALLERRYTGFGLLLALQFLMKRNMLFFLPAFVGIIAAHNWNEKKKWPRILTVSFLPLVLLGAWDCYWRAVHLPQSYSMLFQLLVRFPGILPQPPAAASPIPLSTIALTQFSNSTVFSLKDNIMYFGLLAPVAFFAYLFSDRKEKKDWVLWAVIVSFAATDLLLNILPDIRYFLPVSPFLAILASKGLLIFSKHKKFFGVVLLAGLMQFLAVAGYTASYRKISPDTLRAFAYIRDNTPPDALIVYPEMNFVEYAERRMVWRNFGLAEFLGGNPEKIEQSLRSGGIDYIAVKKNRVYDDAVIAKHYGGYPQSLITWFESSEYLEKIFDNPSVSLWKVAKRTL